MSLMSIYIFFAAGLFLSIIGWISIGLIRNTFLRVFLRTGFVSVFVTPSIIGGDGIAPAPAFLIMAWKGHFWIGIVPILIIWIISFATIMSIPKFRRARTKWPIESISVLIHRPYVKLLFYGLIYCLLLLGLYGYIADLWYLGFLVLIASMIINYFLCLHSFRLTHQGRYILPLLFPAPAGIVGMYMIAVPTYLLGLTGELVAEGKGKSALRVLAVTSLLFIVVSLKRLFLAIKYHDVPHVKIQGGVMLASITFALFLVLTILVSILAWKSKPKQKQSVHDGRGIL